MLSRGENDFSKCDHPLLANCFADHSKGLLTDLAIRDDVIWVIKVEVVDARLGNEFVDLDYPLAFQRDGVELFSFEFDVFALADLVALNDVVGLDLAPRLGVDLFVLDSIAGLLVQLVKANLLALRCGREQ
jgi:hypothetical protein